MKTITATLVVLLSLTPGARAAPLQSCNVTVDVVDQDPKGTNVREVPGGKIVAVLPTPMNDDWIEVHLLGQAGDWFLIDGATRIGDGEKSVFRGKGYVHKSVVGASGLESGARVYADHDDKSRIFALSGSVDEGVKFLGCWNDFAKINLKSITGWTKELCLNQRTTCS